MDGAVRERVKTSGHETVTQHLVYDVHCNTYIHAPVDVRRECDLQFLEFFCCTCGKKFIGQFNQRIPAACARGVGHEHV